jgi:hypothetical protein
VTHPLFVYFLQEIFHQVQKYHTYVSLHIQSPPLPPSMQQLFNKIIKCELHNPLLCKTAFSHQPKLNFLLLRLWWPRGKEGLMYQMEREGGLQPNVHNQLLLVSATVEMNYVWSSFVLAWMNTYWVYLFWLLHSWIHMFLDSYIIEFMHFQICLFWVLSSTFNTIQQSCLTNNALPEELTSSIF